MVRGIIVKSISGEYTVAAENKTRFICKPRGVFRLQETTPKVGDYVEIDEKTKSIQHILPRKNELLRPAVSNIDKAFLIFSVREPDLNLNLLDRLLSIVEYNDIKCIIVFTKLDLLSDSSEFEKIRTYYENIGYQTFVSGFGFSLDLIKEEIENSVCVLAGQSGTGKSTLINRFNPELQLKTDEISYALGRGKHTTRHTELMPIGNGFVADTPGFGNVEFSFDDILTFSQTFREFFDNRSRCRFGRCLHLEEPGCAIREMMKTGTILPSRYENYVQFVNEIKETRKNRY